MFHDESTGADYPTMEELLAQRLVATHDKKGVSYGLGNRSERRKSLRFDRGNPKKPKQYHKPGH